MLLWIFAFFCCPSITSNRAISMSSACTVSLQIDYTYWSQIPCLIQSLGWDCNSRYLIQCLEWTIVYIASSMLFLYGWSDSSDIYSHYQSFQTPVTLDSPVKTAFYSKHPPWPHWWSKAGRHLLKTLAIKKGEWFSSFQKKNHKEGFSNKAIWKYHLEQLNFAECKNKQRI